MKSIECSPVYTRHATHRMMTLLITESEVNCTLREPRITLPGGAGHDDGRTIYVRGRILVVVAESTATVISVKLRSRQRYVHGIHDMSNHPDADRAA